MGGRTRRTSLWCFNPHPSRRTGATPRVMAAHGVHFAFQSSPVPKDGCNNEYEDGFEPSELVSILTRPEGRVQLAYAIANAEIVVVSILTRPEGRVQRDDGPIGSNTVVVSILTRPEGRVQRARCSSCRCAR